MYTRSMPELNEMKRKRKYLNRNMFEKKEKGLVPFN